MLNNKCLNKWTPPIFLQGGVRLCNLVIDVIVYSQARYGIDEQFLNSKNTLHLLRSIYKERSGFYRKRPGK